MLAGDTDEEVAPVDLRASALDENPVPPLLELGGDVVRVQIVVVLVKVLEDHFVVQERPERTRRPDAEVHLPPVGGIDERVRVENGLLEPEVHHEVDPRVGDGGGDREPGRGDPPLPFIRRRGIVFRLRRIRLVVPRGGDILKRSDQHPVAYGMDLRVPFVGPGEVVPLPVVFFERFRGLGREDPELIGRPGQVLKVMQETGFGEIVLEPEPYRLPEREEVGIDSGITPREAPERLPALPVPPPGILKEGEREVRTGVCRVGCHRLMELLLREGVVLRLPDLPGTVNERPARAPGKRRGRGEDQKCDNEDSRVPHGGPHVVCRAEK